MSALYTTIRFALFAVLCLACAQAARAAQFQNATAVVSSQNTINTEQAIDNSATTAATLKAPALLGNARLRLGFGSVVPTGGTVGLVIQAGSTLDLSLLNGMVIRTYLGAEAGYEESLPLSSLINLSLLNGNGGKATVEFTAVKPFSQVELRIAGLLNASFEVDLYAAYASLAAPLPVELLAFEGRGTAAGNALAWSTASERNSSYFVVERADNSPEDFRGVGQVQAAGTATQRTGYTFVDTRPAALSYYRLRQVDRDGTTSFSPVIVLKSTSLHQPLAVYPNPATEAVTVSGTPGTRFAVFDQLGRQLQRGEVPAGALPVLDVRALPGGVYFVRDLATGSSIRFVKAGAGE